jgi:hypothetical protein
MTAADGNAVIVELSGIPGAGKSYLARELVRVLASEGRVVDAPLDAVSPSLGTARRVVRKLGLAAVEAMRDPVAAARLVLAIARSGQPVRDLVHRSQNWLVVRALLRRCRRRPGIHVFDQGLVQELCSIGLRGRWQECLDAAAPGSRSLAADLIVRVVVPVPTATARLANRDGAQSRVEALEPAEQDRVLRWQAEQLDDIERAWLERYGDERGVRRIVLDNDGASVDAAIERVVEQLR